jgi:hypothetical protein
MAMGRPQRPHVCSWIDPTTGKPEMVPGLYKCPDGRWRINSTGQKFTEADERRAVQRFKDQLPKPATIDIPSQVESFEPETQNPGTMFFRSSVPAAEAWHWLREQLIERPAWVGEQVGIPELASLKRFHIPKDAIRIAGRHKVCLGDQPGDSQDVGGTHRLWKGCDRHQAPW